ncbi:MAG: kinase [Deltaproteobacteria bacterium]|nr:kinase [Deltaproteobacteria bacterium]
MIITRTPLRISFFGGGTDYREFYLRHKGAILGTTINKYVYVSLNRLSSFFDYKIRVGYSKAELVNSVGEIVHPSVRECLRYKKIEGNLDIHIFADLPARTGLGSSSAFTVGFLHALHALNGQMVSKKNLAEEARHVEQELIRENVGSQDQYHASHGGLNIMEFSKEGVNVRPLVISREKREAFQQSLMVFYTGLSRHASEVVREQVENTRTKGKDEYLLRMLSMVYEAEKIVSEKTPETMVRELGALLHEGWEFKKKLSTQVSNSLIDQAYQRTLEAGAYGGKLCGAGGGGFLALVVPPHKQDAVRSTLKDLLEVHFLFEEEGSTVIYLK